MPKGQGKTADTYLKTAGSYIKTGDKFHAQFKESGETDGKSQKMSQQYYDKAKEIIAKTKENYKLPDSAENLFDKAKKDTEARRKKQ